MIYVGTADKILPLIKSSLIYGYLNRIYLKKFLLRQFVYLPAYIDNYMIVLPAMK